MIFNDRDDNARLMKTYQTKSSAVPPLLLPRLSIFETHVRHVRHVRRVRRVHRVRRVRHRIRGSHLRHRHRRRRPPLVRAQQPSAVLQLGLGSGHQRGRAVVLAHPRFLRLAPNSPRRYHYCCYLERNLYVPHTPGILARVRGGWLCRARAWARRRVGVRALAPQRVWARWWARGRVGARELLWLRCRGRARAGALERPGWWWWRWGHHHLQLRSLRPKLLLRSPCLYRLRNHDHRIRGRGRRCLSSPASWGRPPQRGRGPRGRGLRQLPKHNGKAILINHTNTSIQNFAVPQMVSWSYLDGKQVTSDAFTPATGGFYTQSGNGEGVILSLDLCCRSWTVSAIVLLDTFEGYTCHRNWNDPHTFFRCNRCTFANLQKKLRLTGLLIGSLLRAFKDVVSCTCTQRFEPI